MENITLGKFSEKQINNLLQESPSISDFRARIDFLSRQFLDVPYKESTLIGDVNTEEVLVINFEGVDCFTLLDHVEALRVSKSFFDFKENLVKVRYQSGEIAFKKRNHFFTDWIEYNSDLVSDMTEKVSDGKCKIITKNLNKKNDGTYFIPGIQCRKRKIAHIPSLAVDDDITSRFLTGDYLGIYSDREGLDVSHVGILIRNNNGVFIRHASSRHRKVVDEDFQKYLSYKPGIVVLRPGRF